MNYNEEFKKFLNSQTSKEEFFELKLGESLTLLKRALPFLDTWYRSSHAGTGGGVLRLMIDIKLLLEAIE